MANLSEFGASLETARDWISELMQTLQVNEPKACRILRVTLHELRDHLTVEEAADLSAQLPLLLRGVYFEGWRPAGKPVRRRTKIDFLERISEELNNDYSVEELEGMVHDVFCFLDHRVSAGEVRHVVNNLPKEIRAMWPEHSGRCTA